MFFFFCFFWLPAAAAPGLCVLVGFAQDDAAADVDHVYVRLPYAAAARASASRLPSPLPRSAPVGCVSRSVGGAQAQPLPCRPLHSVPSRGKGDATAPCDGPRGHCRRARRGELPRRLRLTPRWPDARPLVRGAVVVWERALPPPPYRLLVCVFPAPPLFRPPCSPPRRAGLKSCSPSASLTVPPRRTAVVAASPTAAATATATRRGEPRRRSGGRRASWTARGKSCSVRLGGALPVAATLCLLCVRGCPAPVWVAAPVLCVRRGCWWCGACAAPCWGVTARRPARRRVRCAPGSGH